MKKSAASTGVQNNTTKTTKATPGSTKTSNSKPAHEKSAASKNGATTTGNKSTSSMTKKGTASNGSTTSSGKTTGTTEKTADNKTDSKKDTSSKGTGSTSSGKPDNTYGKTAGNKKLDPKKKTSPKGTSGSTSGNKNDSPWDNGGSSNKQSKTGTGDKTTKMDSCPTNMPKNKSGGTWTADQCKPSWNSCATYNNWSSCPDQWHVSFKGSYSLPTNYCYWQKKYFDARCGCYTYYDSYSSGWYYYEPTVKCYIPVSYCEQYAVERTESLEECDVCEVEVPVCETVREYLVLPVKPVCQPYNCGCN